MKQHFELTDIEFEKQFISCKLPPALFNHEAHLRLAWININKYGLEQAQQNVQTQLENFVKFNGESDKYNKTLTMAAVMIVNHFIQHSVKENFLDFMLEFPKLKTGFKELIQSHYSFDIFNLEKAKKDYLMPDLLPFS